MMITFDAHTADEEAGGEGEEENERSEEEILGRFVATTIADLELEKEYVVESANARAQSTGTWSRVEI